MKYHHELTAWAGVALMTVLGACKTTALPPTHQMTLAQLEALQAQQEAAGDAQGAAATEDAIAEVIADGASETVHGILGPISPLIPGGPLVEAGLAGLAWLAFPRPRQHAVRVLKGLNPSNRELTPLDSLKSLGAAIGLVHSSQATAAAFDEDAPSKPSA